MGGSPVEGGLPVGSDRFFWPVCFSVFDFGLVHALTQLRLPGSVRAIMAEKGGSSVPGTQGVPGGKVDHASQKGKVMFSSTSYCLKVIVGYMLSHMVWGKLEPIADGAHC